jgi:predicted DNA-binding transcriptional regulator AlpA
MAESQAEMLAVDIRRISRMVPFGIRTLRRMDASGRMPRGFKVGQKKVWRRSDIEAWVEAGFPDRHTFEVTRKTSGGHNE